MPKFGKDEITAILEKAVGSALQTPASANNDDNRIAVIEKALGTVTAQIQKMAEMAATGFEKPKSVEEIMADFAKSMDSKIEKALKASKGEAVDDTPIPQTKGELRKMLEETLTSILEKTSKEKPAAKGKGKDDLGKTIEDLDDAGVQNLVDEALEEVEANDSMGNPLTKKQRLGRKALDDYLAKTLNMGSKAGAAADADDDADEGDDE